ncbi:autotransporter assembly complex protein TamA [Phaeobacter inhibens]|uniref:autotransporter assembly complex protein TamA n=1 Tax=Phaeobacter inhibens TaxID=221822 RepID=UPI002207E18B|nr:BamA/TamA family outer membrane protein [Phaeobacter inhibens]UWR49647.1 BamA/TamA family outer membrane protein [Phaeobacter inhibens]
MLGVIPVPTFANGTRYPPEAQGRFCLFGAFMFYCRAFLRSVFDMPRRSRLGQFGRCIICATSLSFGSAAALSAAEARLVAPGSDGDLRDLLQDASATLATSARGETGVQPLMAAALSDYRTLVQVLYDQGYFSPVVQIRVDGREAARIQPLNLPREIKSIEITVKAGQKFTFGTAEITPLPQKRTVDIPEDFATGRTATTAVLRDAANAGVENWRYAGHPQAEVGGQSITANHVAARLDARLRLAPGPQLRFGRLQLANPSAVRAEAIQRIAGFPTGEVFHPDLLSRSATRLRRTGAFSAVTIRPAERANPDGTLDYVARIEDQPPRRFTFGAELSSSDGLEVSGSWMHRNLFGGAERLRFEARLSGIGSANDLDGRVAVRLDRPAAFGPDDSQFYLLEAEKLDEEHYSATRGLGAVGVRRVYSDKLFAEAALGFESVLAEDVFGKRRFKYLVGQLRAEYDGRDSSLSATSGYYLDARAVPFIGIDGSKSGVQLKFDGRAYKGFGSDDRIVLAGRLQMGSVIGPSLSEVSPTLLFYSGGAGSVRGHEFQSLGVPAGGGTSGGRGYLALSGEVRSRIGEKFTLVGFYDVGLVDADSFVSSDSARHAGAGVGLRYDVAGIGAIRLDLAYPVDGGSDDGLQFYIGIGQAF